MQLTFCKRDDVFSDGAVNSKDFDCTFVKKSDTVYSSKNIAVDNTVSGFVAMAHA